ncbi:sensor histidine kinase [Catenulispora sp. GAS73]|uniref:sensor histidine kinase n=1 Tax=Catenulispora sp. GAS73 TaxID=3156269 RepID=UPI0035126495
MADLGPGVVRLSRRARWAGLAVFTVFIVFALVARLGRDPILTLVGVLVAFLGGVPFFLRDARRLLAYAGVALGGVALLATADPRDVGWFAVSVLGAWCVLAGGTLAGVVLWVAGVVLFAAEWAADVHDPGWGAWTAGLSFTVLAAMLVRHQIVLLERLREAQADLAERSRAEERDRIAHELHDVIAHSLTVSLLHVASARLSVEHDPPDAARALAEAERLGRQSLAEVRIVMGLPHSADGVAAPVPNIADLPRLVEQVRDAGVDVCLTVHGDISVLPATTGVTVYRIVQEALTNAARHAPRMPVAVGVSLNSETLRVRVDSAGAPGNGLGRGLLTMRERAHAVGGTCTAGPGGGGWLVEASLPLTTLDAP